MKNQLLIVSLLLAWAGIAAGAGRTAAAPAVGPAPAFAAASLFQDHLVLQREKPVTVWGQAQPGDTVTVRFGNQTKETQAEAQGAWRVVLEPMPASAEGRDLTLVRQGGESIVIKDVLVGEVWLASGQSNMALGLVGALNGTEEIAAAQDPNLRFFLVPTRGSVQPLTTTAGLWALTAPTNASRMSAVGYFFARELRRKLDVPVGVIVSAVGGTPAEAWTSAEAFAQDPVWKQELIAQRAEVQRNVETARTFPEALRAWRAAHHCEEPATPKTEWAAADLDTADWTRASGRFALGKKLGLTSGGVIWLRKEFDTPAALAGRPASLWVDMLDHQLLSVYLNGKLFRTLGLAAPRFYQGGLLSVPVPAGLVQAGRNVLAIRCTTFKAEALKGFAAPTMRLPVVAPKQVSDEWLLKVETAFPALSAEAMAALPTFTKADLIHAPASLFNAMIHPLIPYTIRGAIWYQGESNVWKADRYRELLTTLIGDWRARWGQGPFPFYLVQLANYHGVTPQPAATDRPNPDDALGRLREAQLQVAQHVPETGLAVAIEIGEVSIHPANKQDVGDRLARLALARTYGRQDIAHQSPVYDSMAKEGAAIRVKFKDCPGGLMVAAKQGLEPAKETPDAKLQQFAIAGADHKFVWAEARIDGDSVLVSSPAVPEPVAVRYAWAGNPQGCNLYGRNGLPASPFRTDAIPAAPPLLPNQVKGKR